MTPSKVVSPLFVLLLLCFTLPLAAVEAQERTPTSLPYLTDPAVSPDKSEIVFASGGDIWTVPFAGGEARLLLSHPAGESRPLYSPDGKQLAFVSNRTGNGDLYVLTFATGEAKRLTFDDAPETLDGWSRDGRWLYFSCTSRDIAGMNDILRVSVEGGTPMQLSADRYTNEFFSAPSPDGKSIAFTARGISSSQWWRRGHSHIDEAEIWLMRDSSPAVYEPLTERGAKQMWPMWEPQGKRLYYVSDRGGAQNLWTLTTDQPAAKQLTSFKDGRVLWPSISYDGETIVFERSFRLWKYDTRSRRAEEIAVVLRGAPAGPGVEHVRMTDQIREMSLSPDGKKVAFVVRGEIFSASATDGGDALRVTASPGNETQMNWSPDSRRLAYISDRDGAYHVYLYDFVTGTEKQLTSAALSDAAPLFSPDGKSIAFQRGGRELRAVSPDTGQERAVTTGVFPLAPFNSADSFAWSPDSRWIAFLTSGDRLFSNASVVPASGGESRPVSFLANVGGDSLCWSPDGKYLLFSTNQRTESGRVARVDLIPRTPVFREDQFRDLFREESPKTLTQSPVRPDPTPQPATTAPSQQQSATPTPAPVAAAANAAATPDGTKQRETKTVEVNFSDIRRRLSMLPVGVDVGTSSVSPDGKWLLMIGEGVGQQNLYIYSLDELAKEPPVARQLTSTSGPKSFAQFAPNSKEVFYLEAGRIHVVSLETRAPRPIAVAAEMDVTFAGEKSEIFQQAWSYLRDNFYDETFHGVDWNAVRAAYAPQVAGARTADELRRLISLMVGELDASHLGIAVPPSAAQITTGRLGLHFDRAEYEAGGRFRISEVLALSPASLAKDLKVGDYLLRVDGTALGARTNLDELLSYKINRRVVLTISSSADGGAARDAVVRPTNITTEKGLRYRQWVEANREYVARASGGRLGYVHMFDMSQDSLTQLYLDLDAENYAKEGVVIDVRNNNGGFVNVYAVDVFARRGYLTMTPRGLTAAPARSVLGQRAFDARTILVTNQHSLSDAEDFSEGYRTLRLGKIVGEPTAGWIIYTYNTPLIDGSVFRIPRVKITANDGTVMERRPRPVDLNVTRPIGEASTNRDAQLDAAVRELLRDVSPATQNSANKRDR